MAEVVIWVSGGVVQQVRANAPGLSAEVVDMDDIEALEADREKDPEAFVEYLWSRRELLTGLGEPVVETDPDELGLNPEKFPYVLY